MLKRLAGALSAASLGGVSTGSGFGDILLRAGVHLLTGATQDWRTESIQFATKEAIRYVFPKVMDNYLEGLLAPLVGDPFERLLEEWIKEEKLMEGSGTAEKPMTANSPQTKVDVKVFYNPFTHYVSGTIHATYGSQGISCPSVSSREYVIRYIVVVDGQTTASEGALLRVP